jgi:hypothetical protein
MRAWRARNRERLRLYFAVYRQRQRAATNANGRNYAARKRQASGVHAAGDVLRQLASQGWRCYWCVADVAAKYQVDHLLPLARGGSNGRENIVIACAFCNQSRSDRLADEWPQNPQIERG